MSTWNGAEASESDNDGDTSDSEAENKTEEEWTKAFNTLKINALIVPSHYNIKIKNKFTDNTFSLYTID